MRTFIYRAVICLVCAYIWGVASAVALPDEKSKSVANVGSLRLERIHHDQMLLPDREHAGFGALLYDGKGELVLHDGNKTWLYTTGLFEAPTGGRRDWYGKWISYVREFNVKTFASGESKIVLGLADEDRWAVIHDVIKASEHLFVAFYSSNGRVRAAIGSKPDGPFKTVHDFKIEVTDAWERKGGKTNSLESNGGPCSDRRDR